MRPDDEPPTDAPGREDGSAVPGALSPEREAQLARYLDAVLDETTRVNLTTGRDPDRVAARRRLELPSRAAGILDADPRRIVDIGSGNGYPGVYLAARWPEAEVWLVERTGKKAAAIGRCLARAGLTNARAVALDARDLVGVHPGLRETVDLVTARAVGPIAALNHMAAPLLAAGGHVLHWKADNTPEDELRDGDRAARELGWGPRQEHRQEPVPPGPSRLVLYRRGSGRG